MSGGLIINLDARAREQGYRDFGDYFRSQNPDYVPSSVERYPEPSTPAPPINPFSSIDSSQLHQQRKGLFEELEKIEIQIREAKKQLGQEREKKEEVYQKAESIAKRHAASETGVYDGDLKEFRAARSYLRQGPKSLPEPDVEKLLSTGGCYHSDWSYEETQSARDRWPGHVSMLVREKAASDVAVGDFEKKYETYEARLKVRKLAAGVQAREKIEEEKRSWYLDASRDELDKIREKSSQFSGELRELRSRKFEIEKELGEISGVLDFRKSKQRTYTHEKSSDRSKSIPCKFYQAGSCRYGDSCRFLHVQRVAPKTKKLIDYGDE